MAYEIHWLRRASNELNAIYQFYCEFANEEVARRRLAKIIHSVDLLESMPFLGREDEDFVHIRRYRYMVVLTYKMYYFVEDDGVFVASIWDCRQRGRAFV